MGSGFAMKVKLGHLFLKRVDIKSIAAGFLYSAFATVIDNTKTTSKFQDKYVLHHCVAMLLLSFCYVR